MVWGVDGAEHLTATNASACTVLPCSLQELQRTLAIGALATAAGRTRPSRIQHAHTQLAKAASCSSQSDRPRLLPLHPLPLCLEPPVLNTPTRPDTHHICRVEHHCQECEPLHQLRLAHRRPLALPQLLSQQDRQEEPHRVLLQAGHQLQGAATAGLVFRVYG